MTKLWNDPWKFSFNSRWPEAKNVRKSSEKLHFFTHCKLQTAQEFSAFLKIKKKSADFEIWIVNYSLCFCRSFKQILLQIKISSQTVKFAMNFLFIFLFTIVCTNADNNCIRISCRFVRISSQSNWQIIDSNEFPQIPPKGNPVAGSKQKVKSEICVSFVTYTSEVDQHVFNKMTECAVIDLRRNGIKIIEKTYFVLLIHLDTLNLDENSIQSLPNNVFDDLKSLRKISMRKNLLESLEADLFKFNDQLEFVDFSFNKISRISPQTFSDYPISLVSLRGNLCIDSAYSEAEWENLKADIKTLCSHQSIIQFSVNLMKISRITKNLTIRHESVVESSIESSTIVVNVTKGFAKDEKILNKTSEITQEAPTATTCATTPADLDVLIVSLFWLIVPIILILLGILMIISIAIYKKYVKYSVRHNSRRYWEIFNKSII